MESILLSPVESYFWQSEVDLGRFRIGILARLEGCIEGDLLAAALQDLQRRHPKLRSMIAQGQDRRLRYQFAPDAPCIPFQIIDYDTGESPWRQAMHRLVSEGFPAQGPLGAVVVLRNRARGCSELLLTATHAFTDGLSAIMLMDALLAGYAQAEAQSGGTTEPELPVISARQAKSSGGWRNRLQLFRRFARLNREVKRSPHVALPLRRDIPPLSQWMHWVFSHEDTRILVRRCRQEHASLNAALMAAVYSGLIDCLEPSEGVFTWQCPFSLRGSLEGLAGPVTDQDLGCFMSTMNGFFRLRQQISFWDQARHAHQDIEAFKRMEGPTFVYNMVSFFDSLTTVARQLGFPSRPMSPPDEHITLLATNYGVINIRDAYGSLRTRACTLISNHENGGASLIIQGLVLGRELNVGFAAYNSLDPAFWDRLQRGVRRHLHDAVAVSEPTSSETVKEI